MPEVKLTMKEDTVTVRRGVVNCASSLDIKVTFLYRLKALTAD